MKLKDIMNKKVEFIDANATVYDAIEIMVDRRIRSLVVKPASADDYGMITVRDIVFKVIQPGLDLHKIKVKEIASSPLVCVSQDENVAQIIDLMKQFNIARVFVCKDKKIMGVVALLDVLRGALIQKAKGESLV